MLPAESASRHRYAVDNLMDSAARRRDSISLAAGCRHSHTECRADLGDSDNKEFSANDDWLRKSVELNVCPTDSVRESRVLVNIALSSAPRVREFGVQGLFMFASCIFACRADLESALIL